MTRYQNLKLLKKGAEANIYSAETEDAAVILKKRIVKKYRHPELDRKIRVARTKHEPRLITEAKKAGVSTPLIFNVDLPKTMIEMEHIKGERIKDILNEASEKERTSIMQKVGASIGKLHRHGITHGDLTTSNMIRRRGDIYLIDFGLGGFSKSIEDRGVDLLLLKRALESTHYVFADEAFSAALKAYRETLGEDAGEVVDRISEIEMRARYVSERQL